MSAIMNQAVRRFFQTSARRAAQVESHSAVSGLHEGGYKVWKNMTFFIAFPSIILCALNCYWQHQAHAAHPHEKHFVKYDYLALRNKKFPWGDGNHSLFHNPEVNALPEGYEQ